jgi:hypothetical protein
VELSLNSLNNPKLPEFLPFSSVDSYALGTDHCWEVPKAFGKKFGPTGKNSAFLQNYDFTTKNDKQT